MKKRILFIASVAAFGMMSCQNQFEQGEGSLSLTLSTETTKAAMTADELLANADVRIYKADFSGMVRHYKYSAMPSSIYLPADSYRVDVLAGEAAKESPATASWEQKSYKGSTPFTISANQNTPVAVLAKVNNIVSNISFDSSVAQYFGDSYSCTVGLSRDDASSQLVYGPNDSGKDGFFISSAFEPSLYWSFSGILDGESITKTGEIPAVECGKRYKLALTYVEKKGVVTVDIVVDESLDYIYDDIVFVPVSTGISATGKYEIWGSSFTAYADVDEEEYSQEVYFEYRLQGSESWTRSAAATRLSEGSYSAEISGLEGESSYEYRLVVKRNDNAQEEVIDGISTITTADTPQVPNNSFETTKKDVESKYYYSYYDPDSSDESLQKKWWCSGNAGSTTVGSSYQISYPDTAEKMDGNQSACLASRYVVVKFAAGNLFAGKFGTTIGTSGGTVYFGRPFTARPKAMRLWVKYSGGPINRVDGTPDGVKKGDYDIASLRIALGTWDYKKYGGDAESPVLVNTTDVSTFVDFTTDASTVAFGEYEITSDADNSTNVWRQVTIPLDYHTTTKYPTHIIISFAASKYGDYFTGCDSSKLWVDNVELLY